MTAAETARVRRGMIRYLLVILDVSMSVSAQDFRPSRLSVMLSLTKSFIREFFDQNPLSQLAVFVMRNGLAEKLTELSGSPEAQVKKLGEGLDAGGSASLQNALDLAVQTLQVVPPYGHREVLVIFSALSTCDPGNIFDTIKNCHDHNIRASVVGLAAEVQICRTIADQTGGTYGVAMNENHFEELIKAQASPPAATEGMSQAELVRMGFPQRAAQDPSSAVYVGEECIIAVGGYTCPRCKARVKELPCSCHICGLTLISSPHLARSYHHLFPVKPYMEVDLAQLGADQQYCFGCLGHFGSQGASMVLRCTQCSQYFCFDCDAYVHEYLHNCPGCECVGATDSGTHQQTNGGKL